MCILCYLLPPIFLLNVLRLTFRVHGGSASAMFAIQSNQSI